MLFRSAKAVLSFCGGRRSSEESEFSRLRGNEGYGACDDAGHADNEFNNRCDELAVMESKKFKE